MPDGKRIAGVVLAGGRSSRMGRDKALMSYRGGPLLEHMTALLRQIAEDVYVSGDYKGHKCIPDSTPFAGPAAAIRDVLDRLANYDGVLFAPVDMPFLTPEILQGLLRQTSSAHYEGWPLPLYLVTSESPGQGQSVRQLIAGMNVASLPVPGAALDCFANFNTPEEWKEAARK